MPQGSKFCQPLLMAAASRCKPVVACAESRSGNLARSDRSSSWRVRIGLSYLGTGVCRSWPNLVNKMAASGRSDPLVRGRRKRPLPAAKPSRARRERSSAHASKAAIKGRWPSWLSGTPSPRASDARGKDKPGARTSKDKQVGVHGSLVSSRVRRPPSPGRRRKSLQSRRTARQRGVR
jgi:hypothetical protein